MYGLAALVGLAAGLGAILFEYLSGAVFHGVMVRGVGYAPAGPHGEAELFSRGSSHDLILWALLAAPMVGGLLSGYLAGRFAPESAGHGTDAAIEAYHSSGGAIRGRIPLLKAITTAITLGCGGSGGREGPIAQIGAGFGSFLGKTLGLTRRQRRILLAAGMGAGVGSIFRAPLAGALFSAEILYRDAEFESDVVMPGFLSCAVAYCVYCGWLGDFGNLFHLSGDFTFHNISELVPYAVLGLVLVPVILLYIRVFYGAERLFERIRAPLAIRAAIGGLLTGVIALTVYLSLGDDRSLGVLAYGYGFIQEALDGGIVGWAGVRLLLIVAFLKILTTSCTISSGGSGGVFGPSMVIGAGIGGAVGLTFHELGMVEHPACFVIVGMSGFFAGAAKTPISTIIMVSEMTGSYGLLLPAMFVCTVTSLLTANRTLYQKQVKSRAFSPAHKSEFVTPLLKDMKVSDVFEEQRRFTTVAQDEPLSNVVRIVASTHDDYFPVLDAEGHFVGIFSAHDVRSFTYDDTLHELTVASDIMTTNPICLSLNDTLHLAMERFGTKNIDELPVVDSDDPTQLKGMLLRRAITRAYKERLADLEAAQAEDS